MARPRRLWLKSLVALVPALLALPSSASPQGVVGWGSHVFDSHWNDGPFVQIRGASSNTAARRSNGSVVVWGCNHFNQCSVPPLPPGLTYVDFAVGGVGGVSSYGWHYGHVLGLRSDGSIRAWGSNGLGQCNVPPPPAGLTYTAVGAGAVSSVALRSDGSLVAWGSDQFGMLQVPNPPAGLSFVDIAVGPTYALALLSNGTVVDWPSSGLVPALPPGVTYVEIAAGGFGLARRSDGRVVAWGSNMYGVLDVPALPPGVSYVRIAAGGAHAVACRSDGAAVAWGANWYDQCSVRPPPPGVSYIEPSAGEYHSALRRSDGKVACFGLNRELQCNVPPLPPNEEYVACSVSSYFNDNVYPEGFLALVRSDGEILTAGSAPGPVPLLPSGLRYVQVAAGREQCVALRSDGSVVTWGPGASTAPALPPGVAYTSVAASGSYRYDSCGFGYTYYYNSAYACRSDGVPIAWGSYGICWPPPTLATDQMAPAGLHLLMRLTDGSVVACGNNAHGECSVPPLPPGVRYVDIAAAGGLYWETNCQGTTLVWGGHSLGLCSDGTIKAWGSTVPIPPALPPGLSYVEVACGQQHSVARRSDGSVVAWGFNGNGDCNVPVLPPGEVYVDVEAGTLCTVARYKTSPACGSVSTYCYPASPNSAYPSGATLTADGCPGLTSNDLVLSVSGLPPSVLGLFVYAAVPQHVPFGNGWNCVVGSTMPVLPFLDSTPSGRIDFLVDLTQYPFTGSAMPILPNSSWNFQFWYRDPAAGGGLFNTSNALHFFFSP